jgi:uncharacterized repeat protein (TIGR01451 family)
MPAWAVGIVDSPDQVAPDSDLIYTIPIGNGGPDAATNVVLSGATPANTTFVSISPPAGASCPTKPAGGGTGTIGCTLASLAKSATANFTLVVHVNSGTPAATTISNTASVASDSEDQSAGNNMGTATTSVSAATGGTKANLSITNVDVPDPVEVGKDVSYSLTVRNSGPNDALSVVVADAIPAGTTFRSLAGPAGWSCAAQAVGTPTRSAAPARAWPTGARLGH